MGFRETWNSTTATLVLLRARSTAPIHGVDILRPHPTDEARKIESGTPIFSLKVHLLVLKTNIRGVAIDVHMHSTKS